MAEERTAHAVALMRRFAERTGVTSDRPPRRYLWTDAFAVCTLLELARVTGDGWYGEVALRLVDQVHHVLGRHRADDVRSGWISGLDAHEGEAHPTRGGLRIGKPLRERGPGERMDERREWDRDGQYFHYLTKWMHALDQVARARRQPVFNEWARELADAAHRAFTWIPPAGGAPRMYWKLSIDLSRPQVRSMGQHDPLDGLVTCVQLDATARLLDRASGGPRLARAAADFARMLDAPGLATADPLGIGGLLLDAAWIEQLMRARSASRRSRAWCATPVCPRASGATPRRGSASSVSHATRRSGRRSSGSGCVPSTEAKASGSSTRTSTT
jgi:hypothetical protein